MDIPKYLKPNEYALIILKAMSAVRKNLGIVVKSKSHFEELCFSGVFEPYMK